MHIRSLFLILLGLLIPLAHAQDTPIPAGDKLLAWVGPAPTATDVTFDAPGALVFLNGDGTLEPILELAPGTTQVMACGDQATSPDGQQFAFYVGEERGTLFLMTGALPQLQVISPDVSNMTCVGAGTFVYSADSRRLAYLDYPGNYNTQTSFTGTFVIRDSQTYALLAEFEETAGFDLGNGDAAWVEFVKNGDGEAVEAIIRAWDGTSDRDITYTEAAEDCYFINGNVKRLPDARLAVVLGYRCKVGDGRTTWQFYTVDPTNRSMTLLTSSPSAGRYFPFSRTNAMFVAPDGATVFFATPDGLANYTAAINAVDLAQGSVVPLAPQHVIMPHANARPYAVENHLPVLAPDGSFMAAVRSDANNQATLTVLDFANPGLPPIDIPMDDRNFPVSELIFAPDSSQLYYIGGGESTALYALDLLSGSTNRLSRGRYSQAVLAPDGSRMALVQREIAGERPTPYLTLVVQDLASGSETLIFQGAEIVDNRVTNQRFVVPLAWRRGS